MNLVQRLRTPRQPTETRNSLSWYFDQMTQWMSVTGGGTFPTTTWTSSGSETAPHSFDGYCESLFKSDPVVYAAETIRLQVFAQARFQYRRFQDGRPTGLFGDRSLRLLERPWRGGTTSDLLARMGLHADIAGNAYVLNLGNRLRLLRPDWVSIVLGSELEPDDPAVAEDADVVGYMYFPGGQAHSRRGRLYLPEEVAHFAPTPDPQAHFRGMSWMTPVVREIQGDKAATEHKLKFFENGATPNMVVKFDPTTTVEQVKAFKAIVEEEHQGHLNAYKTLYLGGGADADVVGADFQQLDFRGTQGKGETRILMAAGVHPVIAGASEGLQGSSLNAGNYGQAKRLFSDVRLQHLWRNAAASLEPLLKVPAGAELWFDARDIPFLQDDLKDTAEVQQKQAAAIRQLVDGGFTPDSVVEAVQADDFALLTHTGKLSVQLQEPGADDTDPDTGSSDEQGDA